MIDLLTLGISEKNVLKFSLSVDRSEAGDEIVIHGFASYGHYPFTVRLPVDTDAGSILQAVLRGRHDAVHAGSNETEKVSAQF